MKKKITIKFYIHTSTNKQEIVFIIKKLHGKHRFSNMMTSEGGEK